MVERPLRMNVRALTRLFKQVLKCKPIGHCRVAVSYTHLDVYKRQVYYILVGVNKKRGWVSVERGNYKLQFVLILLRYNL